MGGAILLLLMIAGLALRLGPQTTVGRALLLARLEGLSLGSVGRLHIEGLKGDVWRDFTVDRLDIVDARGAWLEARRIEIRWRWIDLLDRRVHVQSLAAASVEILRRPTIVAGDPASPSPVSVSMDRLSTRLATRPAFSLASGLFRAWGRLDLRRSGSVSGALNLDSLLHPGDQLRTQFKLRAKQPPLLDAQAREGPNGALAGALGLPPTQGFRLAAHMDGDAKGGRLHLRALSGDRSIAEADGAWDRSGGKGEAVISLSASTLAARFSRQLGPQLRLSGQGRGVGGGLYEMALRASADNARITAAGVVDPARRAIHGDLRLAGDIGDPTRFIAAPAIGSASFDGRLSGAAGDWRVGGHVVADRLTYGGYSLGRVSGPFDLRYAKREARLRSTLEGLDGRGAGWIAGVAGVRPRLSADLSRLADGRVLVRALKAEGDGLQLNAEGEVGLFGALSFKGGLRASNLAAAYKGARGALRADWSAAQRKAGAPWTGVIDAQGADISTGSIELDRLLGRSPRLWIDAAFDRGLLVVTASDLTGAAVSVHASGKIDKTGGLDLLLKGSGRGPFTVGPLDMAGDINATGAVQGSISQPRADLLADFQRIDLPGVSLRPARAAVSLATGLGAKGLGAKGPGGVQGVIAVTATGGHGPAHAKASFQIAGDDVVLTDIDAAVEGATAAGGLTLRHARPSSADLTLSVGPGAFAARGHADLRLKINDTGAGPTANARLSISQFVPANQRPGAPDVMARDSSLVVNSARIDAAGPLTKMAYTLTGDAIAAGAPIRVKGAGAAFAGDKGFGLDFEGSGRVRHADFHTQAPARLSFGGDGSTATLNLALGGGHLDLDARQAPDQVDAKLRLTEVDLGALGEDIAGRLNADLSLSGKGASLNGVLNARLLGARSRDASAALALSGDLRAVLAGSRLTIDASANGAHADDRATVRLSAPAEAAAAPFRVALVRTRPIEGEIDARGEVQPIWDLFFGGDRELGGRLTARAAIAGTLNDPRLTGAATLAQGRFEDAPTGLKLRNLAADIDLRDNAVDVRRFSANDASGGGVSGQGRVSLLNDGASTLTLKLRGFRLVDTDSAKANASGDVTVTRGADGKAKLTGAVTIDRADITAASDRRPAGVVSLDVTEKNKPVSDETPAAPPGRTPRIGLDISVRAPGHVYVRGLGLNAEMSVAAKVEGTTAAPILSGVARVVRGDYDLAGKRFEIDDSGVVHLASTSEKTLLDLNAKLETSTLTAVIKIHGTAAKPEITLTSTPTLPADEILSQVLFGQSAAQLSPVEAAQLASSVATLATGGGFDVMGGLRSFARLDRLALGGGDSSSSGVTVSGGKYIGNKVYLELTGGGRQGPSAQVEVRANRALSFVSQVGGEYGAKLSVRWKLDYGKPRKDAK